MGIASLATSNPEVFCPFSKKSPIQLSNCLPVNVKVKEALTELLKEFYDSAFRPENGQPIPTLPIPSVMMGNAVFTPCLDHKELSTLDTSKSSGPYQQHP